MWYVRISWEWKRHLLEYVKLGWDGKISNRNLWKYGLFLFIKPCMKVNDTITENNVEKLCRHCSATCSEGKGADRKVFWAIICTLFKICGRKVNCGTSEHYLLLAQTKIKMETGSQVQENNTVSYQHPYSSTCWRQLRWWNI